MKRKPGITSRFIPVAVVREEALPDTALDDPALSLAFWRSIIAAQPDYEADKETLAVILLSSRLRPFAWHRVSLGSVTETTAHPREIFRPVILGAAFGFVLMHNHPAGDVTPSRADKVITRRLTEAADLMQLRMIDHLIVAEADRLPPGFPPYYSFREAGIIV